MIQSDDMDPESTMINQQKIKHMRNVVSRLKPRYRKLVELRYFKEYSYDEIAEELDIPIGTVKAQLVRARELLLIDHCGFGIHIIRLDHGRGSERVFSIHSLVEGNMACSFLPNEVDTVVGCDLEKPGGKGEIGSILVNILKSFPESFDGQILGIYRTVNHFEKHEVDGITVPAEKFAVGELIPLPGFLNQFHVLLGFQRKIGI
jgi:hypothetical protein